MRARETPSRPHDARKRDPVDFAIRLSAPGNPTLVIPMGLNKEGLPIGLQIVGARYSEPELLHFAKLLKPFTPGFTLPPGH